MLYDQTSSMLHRGGDSVQAMHTSDRIRALRKRKDWSQRELGDRVGVSKAAVSQWEIGSTKGLKPEHLIAVADALGVSVRYLVTGKEEAAQPPPIAKESVIDTHILADILSQIRELWGDLPRDKELAEIIADGYTRTMLLIRERGREEIRAIMADSYAAHRVTNERGGQREKSDE